MSTRRALRQLRRLEPGALFDYDHIYGGSASGADAAMRPWPERADSLRRRLTDADGDGQPTAACASV
jgi:hypothetical protein